MNNNRLMGIIDSIIASSDQDATQEALRDEIGSRVLDILNDKKQTLARVIYDGEMSNNEE